ncbi:hypothetical protein [Primorskyibacter sp. S187A]|uniref:hypothetical protein n=1 Tax=Primorskyibacter sp. S187A TaxID=3415130 RepID=UPI003C7D8354
MRQFVWIPVIALCACAQLAPRASAPEVKPEVDSELRPQARPESLDITAPPAPPVNARTAEQFDTTSAEDRAAAAATPAVAQERDLGTSVASLGDPAQPGFWLETPLVREETQGRVVYNGKSSAVTLRPIEGPATAGSRLSLAAMRLIGAPLTGLPEVQVFAN